jgi:hypothetical protein
VRSASARGAAHGMRARERPDPGPARDRDPARLGGATGRGWALGGRPGCRGRRTGYLVTLVERVTRFACVGWVSSKDADEVAGVIISAHASARCLQRHHVRQRQGVRASRLDSIGLGGGRVLCQPVPLLGTRHERELERTDQTRTA